MGITTNSIVKPFAPHHRAMEMALSGMFVCVFLIAGCQDTPSRDVANPSSPGLPNFSKVADGVYRGGQPTDAGYQTLKNMGVRTILSLRVLGPDSQKLRAMGFRQHHISFKHIHPETEDVLEFLAIVTAAENQPVFVHCREGVDRTGMMIAIYRMVVQDWPKAKAIDEMKRMGFNEWNEPIEHYLQNLDVKQIQREMQSRSQDVVIRSPRGDLS